MAKKINKRYPVYFEDFKCIGGKCEDSCCIGWNIDIDKVTFKRYFKVQDQEMKRMFQKNVQNNERCSSDEVDYGIVKLKKDKRCPFLDEENYCVIHSNLGEDYLSNVCTCFPRVTNNVDEIYEMSLDVSCPEAARLILSKEEGIKFIETNEPLQRHIISSYVNTKEADKIPIKYLKGIREVSIKIIQNRKYKLTERLFVLGEFINKVEDEINDNYDNVLNFIKEYNFDDYIEDDNLNTMNFIIQIDFFKKMLKILNVQKEALSEQLKDYTKDIEGAFNLNNEESLRENFGKYIKVFDEYKEEYEDKYSYIFENYLVNFIYNNLFPFNGHKTLFDGYIMLLMRYSFIRFYLVGMYLNEGALSKENIIEVIQAFSKTIEHHRSFLIDALAYIKRQEFDNMEFAKLLL